MASRLETSCPFCGFKPSDDYELLLHVETLHAEGDSPFVANLDEDNREEARSCDYHQCPMEGCCEMVEAAEIPYHMEHHKDELARNESDNELSRPFEEADEAAPRGPLGTPESSTTGSSRRSDRGHRVPRDSAHRARKKSPGHRGSQRKGFVDTWKERLSGRSPSSGKRQTHLALSPQLADGRSTVVMTSEPQRLGKAELGKYANEKKMPDHLISLLQRKGQVASRGVVDVLAQLLQQNKSTKCAYVCHPCVQHVTKLRREGGFCGYRNIQMMVSYLIGVGFPGSEEFGSKLPTIFDIQDYVERAWDMGINSQGRIETGGIRDTRKHIGTPEAQAMFCLLQIPCNVQAFKVPEPGKSAEALLRAVEAYFSQQGTEADEDEKVRRTTLPPIYFQYPGHSLTIVGYEKQNSGQTNLLVFDPIFRDSDIVMELIGRQFRHKHPSDIVKPYRRGPELLHRHREFEILSLA